MSKKTVYVNSLNNKEKLDYLIELTEELIHRRIAITSDESLRKDVHEQLEIIADIKKDMDERDLIAEELKALL